MRSERRRTSLAEIQIFADTRNRSTCRSCGAHIEWAETIAGKRMPFDAPIVAVRTIAKWEHESGRTVEIVESTVSKSHFATCPDAGQWRKKR